MSNDQIEVSFRNEYDPSTKGNNLPISVDIRSYYNLNILFSFSIYESYQSFAAFAQVSLDNCEVCLGTY